MSLSGCVDKQIAPTRWHEWGRSLKLTYIMTEKPLYYNVSAKIQGKFYSAFFPEHSKRIHLLGKPDLTKLVLAQATCSEFGVALLIEEIY